MNFTRIPKIEKLIFVASPKDVAIDRKKLIPSYALLYLLTGEYPSPIFAKKPAPEYEIKKGQCRGIKAIICGEKIKDFIYKYCIFHLAKQTDFEGLPKQALDRNGNYKLFITDPKSFPEVERNLNHLEKVEGFSVNVVTSKFCRKYHVACDPTKLPSDDYYWLIRQGFSLKTIESRSKKRYEIEKHKINFYSTSYLNLGVRDS